MAGETYGQITSAYNGTNVPDDNGFVTGGKFTFMIANGTTIDAALQVKTRSGNWVTLPDVDGNTTLSAATAFLIDTTNGGPYRINVTTATGTWDWQAE